MIQRWRSRRCDQDRHVPDGDRTWWDPQPMQISIMWTEHCRHCGVEVMGRHARNHEQIINNLLPSAGRVIRSFNQGEP